MQALEPNKLRALSEASHVTEEQRQFAAAASVIDGTNIFNDSFLRTDGAAVL